MNVELNEDELELLLFSLNSADTTTPETRRHDEVEQEFHHDIQRMIKKLMRVRRTWNGNGL